MRLRDGRDKPQIPNKTPTHEEASKTLWLGLLPSASRAMASGTITSSTNFLIAFWSAWCESL